MYVCVCTVTRVLRVVHFYEQLANYCVYEPVCACVLRMRDKNFGNARVCVSFGNFVLSPPTARIPLAYYSL